MSTSPLPISGCPVVERLCCGNVFTEPLFSNGHMRHNIKILNILRITGFSDLVNYPVLRLALSNGPNRVSFSSSEGGNRSSFQNVVFSSF
jgi:hypothetical protein